MEFSTKNLFYLIAIVVYFPQVQAQVAERIIGGNYSNERQFPYQISLQIEGRQHRCGGGIIGERFILTAAHCVINDYKQFEKSHFKVVADTTDLNDFEKGRSVDVEKIYVPISYWQTVFRDDIAVLKLKQDLGLNNGLSKLELPTDGQTYVGQTAKVTGYGWLWIRGWGLGGATDYKLKYLDVNVIANDKCQIEEGTISAIHDSNICGQAVQQSNGRAALAGICNGDSGGPLVIGSTVIGIVSLSTLQCVENVYHARYTRVSSFLQFINNVIRGIRTTDMRVYNVDGSDDTRDVIAFPEN